MQAHAPKRDPMNISVDLPNSPRGRGEQSGGPPPEPKPLPTLADLRARSTEDVMKTVRGAGMIIEGWIVPEDESITFAEKRQNPVDLIVGSNKDEQNSFGGPPGSSPSARPPSGNACTGICSRTSRLSSRA